jgi:4-hydroxybenzoate polyprenyltransferase
MIAESSERPSARRWNWADVQHFLRVEYLPFAMSLPLLGAASVSGRISLGRIIALLGAALAFHIYTGITNDLADLPLDRTQPMRAEYPLVKGTIRPWQALMIALIQIPIAAALTALQNGGAWAYAALGLGLVSITVYNVWGKRTPFPVVTDLVQGIAFASMALYGAAVSGSITPVTWIVFVSIVAWMMQTNLLGGLRDLASDYNHGARTTPILLGARPKDSGQIHPRAMRVYAYEWETVMIGLGALVLILNPFGYAPALQAIVAAVFVVFSGVALWLLSAFFESAVDYPTMISVGKLQMLSSSILILILFGPALDVGFLILLAVVFALGMLRYEGGPARAFLRRKLSRQN